MSITYREFKEKIMQTSFDDLKDIRHINDVITELNQIADNPESGLSDKEYESVKSFRKNLNAVYAFMSPLDKQSFYDKKTDNSWKEINKNAEELNKLLNDDAFILLLNKHSNEKLNASFFGGIDKLNEICGFGLDANNMKEAAADPAAYKQQMEDRLAAKQKKEKFLNMPIEELGEMRRKHAEALENATSFKNKTQSFITLAESALDTATTPPLDMDIKDFSYLYLDSKVFKGFEDSVKNVKTIGTTFQLREKGKLVDKHGYVPSDVFKAVKKVERKLQRYQKAIADSEAKYLKQNLVYPFEEYADFIFEEVETIEEATKEIQEITKNVPQNVDVNITIAKEQENVSYIDEIMNERNISLDELESTVRQSRMNAANDKLKEMMPKAEATQKKVFNGSDQFTNALTAIGEYSAEVEKYKELRNDPDMTDAKLSDAAKALQEKANEAKELIGKYFKRKNKELWNNANSKERMGLMSDALEAIKTADEQISGDKKIYDENVKKLEAQKKKEAEEKQRKLEEEQKKLEEEQKKLEEQKKREAAEKAKQREAEIKAEKESVRKMKENISATSAEIEAEAENVKQRSTFTPTVPSLDEFTEKKTINSRINAYKAQSKEFAQKRKENEEAIAYEIEYDKSLGDKGLQTTRKDYGTAFETATAVCAESLTALNKMSKTKTPLTPEQKQTAIEHIANIYAYDTGLVSPEKDYTKEQFTTMTKELASTNSFKKVVGDITQQSLREFCTDANKVKSMKGVLFEEQRKEMQAKLRQRNAEEKQRQAELEAPKKNEPEKKAKPKMTAQEQAKAKRELKKKNEAFDNRRLDAPSLNDLYQEQPATRKRSNTIKKPKGKSM